jgi:predicted nucleotidyltransferase
MAPVLRDFSLHHAEPLATAFELVRAAALENPDMDDNRRDGVTYVDHRGPVVEALIRVPADRLDDLRRWLLAAHSDRPAPTLDSVTRRLGEIGDRLVVLGVTGLWVYGSVARGDAGPASDIDVLYSAAGDWWATWSKTQSLLEDTLGAMVDLYPHANDSALAKGARQVWSTPLAGRTDHA